MSIFRPLNSDESNLFTIRCVITFSSSPSGMIAGGSKITVTTSLLTAPTSNNLPDYFGIFFSASNKFYVTYGKEFTSTPCVSITPRMGSEDDLAYGIDATDNPIPMYYWNNIQKYENSLYPNASNYNFVFCFKDGNDGNIVAPTNSTPLNGFDLIITGPVKLGVTTGNSNKGWSVGSGNDATTAYSYMDIGIGKGNPVCSLDINGGFKTTTLVLTHEKIDGVTVTPAITAKDSGKIVTLDASAGAITLILPTPAAGLNYKFIVVATNNYPVTIKSSSDGTNVTNLMMGSITVSNSTQNVTSAADELVFAATSATIGDIAEVVCDGTNWFWNATGAQGSSITLS